MHIGRIKTIANSALMREFDYIKYDRSTVFETAYSVSVHVFRDELIYVIVVLLCYFFLKLELANKLRKVLLGSSVILLTISFLTILIVCYFGENGMLIDGKTLNIINEAYPTRPLVSKKKFMCLKQNEIEKLRCEGIPSQKDPSPGHIDDRSKRPTKPYSYDDVKH